MIMIRTQPHGLVRSLSETQKIGLPTTIQDHSNDTVKMKTSTSTR